MLPDKARGKIAETFINPIRNKLISSIEMTLKGGEDWIKRIHELELLLKTDRNEYFTYSFKSVREAMIFLLELQEDVADLRDIL